MKQMKLIALVFLLVGVAGYFLFSSNSDSANAIDAATQAACEAKYANQPTIKPHCKEATFAIAQSATNAQDAASKISAINRSETGLNGLAMFFAGLAVVGGLLSLATFFKKK